MENKSKDWNKVWSNIKEQMKLFTIKPSYDSFIKPVELISVDDDINIAYLAVPDKLNIDIVKRYTNKLQDYFFELTGEKYSIIMKYSNEYGDTDASKKKRETSIYNSPLINQKIFIPEYTFENFVEGSCNKFAYAAAYAVAENPSEAYNPLYIYGGSGLGKTHLMNAIGIHLIENRPELNVLYVTAETFTNECTFAIKQNKMNDFKNKYRKLDVLLIDDIQFLENKESTQEEFFHTFNELHKLNKQIIISSDRAPNKLTKLDQRLTSRFAWKMMADIQPADYETRVAILMQKAENKNIEINDEVYEVIALIAEKIKDNIRELEGAFNRIVTFSLLLNRRITKKFARDILKDILKTGEVNPTPEKIKSVICRHYNITIEDLEGKKRTNNIAYPRQIAMYMCRNITDYSLPKIGEVFGDRHYSTVIHACDKIEKELKKNENLKDTIEMLNDMVKE